MGEGPTHLCRERKVWERYWRKCFILELESTFTDKLFFISSMKVGNNFILISFTAFEDTPPSMRANIASLG